MAAPIKAEIREKVKDMWRRGWHPDWSGRSAKLNGEDLRGVKPVAPLHLVDAAESAVLFIAGCLDHRNGPGAVSPATNVPLGGTAGSTVRVSVPSAPLCDLCGFRLSLEF